MKKIYIAGCLEILGSVLDSSGLLEDAYGRCTEAEWTDLLRYIRLHMGDDAERMVSDQVRGYKLERRDLLDTIEDLQEQIDNLEMIVGELTIGGGSKKYEERDHYLRRGDDPHHERPDRRAGEQAGADVRRGAAPAGKGHG